MIIGIEFAQLYCVPRIDIDGTKYMHTRAEVMQCTDSKIVKIIDHFRKQIKQSLYIKCNWLYFIYLGHRFQVRVSNSSEEYMFIRSLIYKLRENGCSCIYYDGGVLD